MSYLSQFLGAGSVLRVTSYTSGIDASVGTFNPLVAKSRVLVFLTGGGSSGTHGYNGGIIGVPAGGQGGASSGTVIFSLSLPGSVSYTIGAGGAASGAGSNAGGVSVFGQQTTASNVEPYCTYPGFPITTPANNWTGSYTFSYFCRSGSGGSASYYSQGGSGGSGGSGAGQYTFNTGYGSYIYSNAGAGSAGYSGLCLGGLAGVVTTSVSNGATPGIGGGGGGGGSLAINNTGVYFGNGGAGGPGYIEIWEYGV